MQKFSREGDHILDIVATDGYFACEPGAPAVLEDGALVALGSVRDENQQFVPRLYVIEDCGDVRWTLPLDSTVSRSIITLGPEGTIYCACSENVYSVSSAGAINWSYLCDSKVITIPGCAPDNTLFVGTIGGVLYSLSSQGALNWTFAGDGAGILSAPTTDEDGNVYFVRSRDAFYCLQSNGDVAFSYPVSGFSYTSPILLNDGSVVFCAGQIGGGPSQVICIDSGGSEKWKTNLFGDQTPLTSPVADKVGNVYLAYPSSDSMRTTTYSIHFARIDRDGEYEEIDTYIIEGYSVAGGTCIGSDGTLYLYMGDMLRAYGAAPESVNIEISTELKADDPELGWIRAASISLTNTTHDLDLDCYVAYREVGSDELFFYPFWSNEPANCALEFRPLPADAQFPKIELIHLQERTLETGEYEFLAGLFEPGTFDPLCEIALCSFTVLAQPISDADSGDSRRDKSVIGSDSNGTPPAIQVWTDKRDYTAGETLNLSLSFDNQGFGMPYDFYIAARLDADPTGTLFFFPTWATDPSFTNISFLPLVQGALLPELTIMHLELPASFPKGDYTFLAAFFVSGRFDLASEIAEAHWTLM
ncbi:PQQ-like beta-propeller repeat protein [bacterium]|nr:PQQ-like beta-propeller repeat protein [bacterium]